MAVLPSTSTNKRSLVLLCGATLAVGAATYIFLRSNKKNDDDDDVKKDEVTAAIDVTPQEEDKAEVEIKKLVTPIIADSSAEIETKKETPTTSRSLPISTGEKSTEVADVQKTTTTTSSDDVVVTAVAKNNTSKSPIKPKTKKWLDRLASKKGNKKNKDEERNKTMNEDEIDTFLEDLSTITATTTTKDIPSPSDLSSSEIVSPKEKPTNSETTSEVNKVKEVPPSTPWVGDVEEQNERTSSNSPTKINKPTIPFNELPLPSIPTNVTSRNRRRRNRGKKKDKIAQATTTTTSSPTSSTTTTKSGAKQQQQQQSPTKNSTAVPYTNNGNGTTKTATKPSENGTKTTGTTPSSNTTNGGGEGAVDSSANAPASIAADIVKNKKKRNRRNRKPKGTAQSAAVKEMKEFQQKG